MYAMDAVADIIKRTDNTKRSVSIALGLSDNYINNVMSRGSTPQANTLAKMLEACGYALCAVPADEIPPNALVIGDEDGTE